jgi:hypothetical protein
MEKDYFYAPGVLLPPDPVDDDVAAIAMWPWSNMPIAVPTAIVIPKPKAKVTSFGCAAITFMILPFIDIFKQD